MSKDWWIELAELKSGRTKMEREISKLRSRISMLESENNNMKVSHKIEMAEWEQKVKDLLEYIDYMKPYKYGWDSFEEWKANQE